MLRLLQPKMCLVREILFLHPMSAKYSSYRPLTMSLASFLSMRNHIQSASLLPVSSSSCASSSLPCCSAGFYPLCSAPIMLCSYRLYGTPSLHRLSACHRLPGLINAIMLVLSLSLSNRLFILPSLFLGWPSSTCFRQPGHHFPFASFIRTCPERGGNIIFRCKFNASRLHASTG